MNLEQIARTKTKLNGNGALGLRFPPTRAGRQAQEIWRPLFPVIEDRWQQRFGKSEIEQLRKSLWALIQSIDLDLPDCLPILQYGCSAETWLVTGNYSYTRA